MTKRKAWTDRYLRGGSWSKKEETPQAMLKRLQKSLKDPYPRPWCVIPIFGYGTSRKVAKSLCHIQAADRSLPVYSIDRRVGRLIVKAVNAQHETRKRKRR